MLWNECRRCTEAFLTNHGADLGQRSTFDLDQLLDSV